MTAPVQHILLLEPQYVLRRAITMVARDLGAVDFHEASNTAHARTLLENGAYDGLVVDLLEGAPVITLLNDLRQGQFASQPNVWVIVVGADSGLEKDPALGALAIDRMLPKPFKIGELLNAVMEASPLSA